jgi:hypothetical protein
MRGKHRSLDKDLKRSILWLEGVPGITKIVLGFSECCRHKYPPGHVKIRMDVDAGVKINGYSGKGVTDIFLRIDPISYRNDVKAAIENKFGRN